MNLRIFVLLSVLMTVTVTVWGQKMQMRHYKEGSMTPPTEEERASRNDQGFGKPRNFREEDDVLVLTDTNMGVAVNQFDFLLVEFYAPWCGHCKKLAPEYAAAAAELKEDNIMLGKVDSTMSRKLHQKYNIEGFPTMYFFKHGKPITYTGGNKKDSIVKWARRHAQSSSTELSSIEAVEAKQEMMPQLLIGYFPPSDTLTKAHKAYLRAAEMKENLNFFHTTSEEVIEHLGLGHDGGIAVLKKYDEGIQVINFSDHSDDTVSDAIDEFVSSTTYPLVSVFSKDRAREIFSPRILTHVLVFTDPQADYHNSVIETVTKLAKQFRGQAQVINIEGDDASILKHFEVDRDSFPAIVVMDVEAMDRYPFVSDVSTPFYEESEYDSLAEHVQSVIDNDL